MMMTRIPQREARKIYSAIVSRCCSRSGFNVLIDKNEKKQEKDKRAATTEVNSSMILASVLLARCKEVITKRQKPKRFAEVFSIC